MRRFPALSLRAMPPRAPRGGRTKPRPPRRRPSGSAGTRIDANCYVCGGQIAPEAQVRCFMS
jgi:hypothetical protein